MLGPHLRLIIGANREPSRDDFALFLSYFRALIVSFIFVYQLPVRVSPRPTDNQFLQNGETVPGQHVFVYGFLLKLFYRIFAIFKKEKHRKVK